MLCKSLLPIKIILLLLLLALILLIAFMFNPFKKSTGYEILEIREFSCPEMTGFTFKYLNFKDWGVKDTRSNGQGRCTMFFNWPNIIEYEIAPQITIEKSAQLGQKFTGIMSAKKKNSASIPYEYITDSSQYAKDYVFKTGDWDWLVFYGQDFGVKISRNVFGSLNNNKEAERQKLQEFDSDIFYKTIIDSFRFTE